MEIYLIRHTRVLNPLNLCYGCSEMPLSPDFEKEAHRIKEVLKLIQPDQVYSSDSERTKKLANYLEYYKVKIEPLLNELDFGEWEQKAWSDIPKKELNTWMRNYYFEKPSFGESYEDLKNRTRKFIKEKLNLIELGDQFQMNYEFKNSKVLIFTHAGPIRCFLSLLLHLSPYEAIRWKVPEGGIWRIKIYNHLQPLVFPPQAVIQSFI